MRLDNLDQRGGAAISIQTSDGGVFDAIVFGEAEAAVWMAGSEHFLRYRGCCRQQRKRGDKVASSMSRSPMPATVRSGSSAMAGRTENRTNRPALSLFPRATPRSSSVCGTHRPAATGCWPGQSRGQRSTTAHSLRRKSPPRPRRSETISTQPRSLAALPVESRAERSRLLSEIEKMRSAAAGQSRKAYAVSPREAGAMHVDIRGNPNQAGEVVAAGAVAAVVAPGVEFGLAADAPESARRKALASWIASCAKPAFCAGGGQPALAGTLRSGSGRDIERPGL